MTDNDYIKKAVELADGWTWTMLCALEKSVLKGRGTVDALAAQLVRQVDALDTPDTVEITHDSVWVGYRSKNNESWKRTKRTKSRDRTMNTIKAIVDSGVLFTGDSG